MSCRNLTRIYRTANLITESVKTNISWQAKPVAGLQAGAKYTVARQMIVDDACGPGLYLVLGIIQRLVAEMVAG